MRDIGTTDILDIPGEYYGDYVDDYNHNAIRTDYQQAVQAALPEGVYLMANGMVFAEEDAVDAAYGIDWSEIAESVDIDEIIQRHDRTEAQ